MQQDATTSPQRISDGVMFALSLALAVVLAAVAAGLGVRWGWWSFGTGFSILKYAVIGALISVPLSLLGLWFVVRRRRRGRGWALLALAAGLAGVWVPLPPAQVCPLALAAAQDMGWDVAETNEREGRIEATATTFWFGFKDDVVVRLTPVGAGSRIDVRSVSRVGVSDLGVNAQRIRAYLKRLARG